MAFYLVKQGMTVLRPISPITRQGFRKAETSRRDVSAGLRGVFMIT